MGEIDSDTDDVNVSNSVDSGDDTGNNSNMMLGDSVMLM